MKAIAGCAVLGSSGISVLIQWATQMWFWSVLVLAGCTVASLLAAVLLVVRRELELAERHELVLAEHRQVEQEQCQYRPGPY